MFEEHLFDVGLEGFALGVDPFQVVGDLGDDHVPTGVFGRQGDVASVECFPDWSRPRVVRPSAPATEDEIAAIYPSDEKYSDSQG